MSSSRGVWIAATRDMLTRLPRVSLGRACLFVSLVACGGGDDAPLQRAASPSDPAPVPSAAPNAAADGGSPRSAFAAQVTPAAKCTLETAPIIPAIDAATKAAISNVFQVGQSRHRHNGVFMKLGDSLTDNLAFLAPFGTFANNLAITHPEYQALATLTAAARLSDGKSSFDTWSLGARRGWTTQDMLATDTSNTLKYLRPTTNDRAGWTATYGGAQWTNPWRTCPGKTAVQCELDRANGAFAIVMAGTNDVTLMRQYSTYTQAVYEANLRLIVTSLTSQGVVVILSTIPPMSDATNHELARRINASILKVAGELGNVPVWNLYRQLAALPNLGISGDGVHLSCADAAVLAGPESACLSDEARASFAGYVDPVAVASYGFNARNLGFFQAYQHVRDEIAPYVAADIAPCAL